MPTPLAGHTNSHHTYSFDQALAGIARAGVQGVELSAVPGWTEHVSLDDDPAAVRRKVEGYGLLPVSLSAHSDLTTKDGLEHALRAGPPGAARGARVRNTAMGAHEGPTENEPLFLENVGALADAAERE